MSRQMKGSEPRRKLLQKTLNPEAQGGFTIHAAKLMAEPLGGRPAECILSGHCRTFVFEFPWFPLGRRRAGRISANLCRERA